MDKIFRTLLIAIMGISAVLILWAIFATPEGTMVPAEAPVIGYNMIWGYILLAVAIVCCLFSAIWSMVQNPKGMKVAGLSIAAIVVIVVVSAIIASRHDIQIPDVQNNSYFHRPPTVLTDASILITYVALGAAILAAIYSAVSDSLK